MVKFVFIFCIAINVLSFCLFGIDKYKSKNSKRRISEQTLLLVAIFGGSIGALLGMDIFRHKTLHKKFRIGLPLIFLVQLAIVMGILFRKNIF